MLSEMWIKPAISHEAADSPYDFILIYFFPDVLFHIQILHEI